MKYKIIITLIILLILGGLVVLTSDNSGPVQPTTRTAPADKNTQSLKDLKLN